MTVAICLFFGMAAFATNQRLLYTLRSQKETTAAIMVLQQRRESLRGIAFTDIATADTLKNVIKVPTGSEAPLSNLSETLTVSVDPTDAAYTGPSPTPTVFLRDKNNTTPSKISQNNNLPITTSSGWTSFSPGQVQMGASALANPPRFSVTGM